MKRSWRQDSETGKLVEILRTPSKRLHSVGVFQELVSPVTGERIANRQQMADHQRRTGMTNDMDSLREQTRKELTRKPDTGTRKERITAIRTALEKASSSGYHRTVQYED
jgi:hypothetical protein